MKQWFQVTMAIEADVGIVAAESALLLLQVNPTGDILIASPDGRMYLNVSCRPWYVPLTQQEASRVLDAQAMGDASELRRSSTGEPLVSMTIGLHDLQSESAT